VQQMRMPPVMARSAADKRAHVMREIVEIVLFVGLVFVIAHFVVASYGMNGNESMKPQLRDDDEIIVNRAAYILAGPSRGDVVLFASPANAKKLLLGRVIAIPGDTITITPTQVQVNGVALRETYVQAAAGGTANPIIIPQETLASGQYFILDDNRAAVDQDTHQFGDSRTFGPIPRADIQGKAALVFWPLKSVRGVSNFADVFSHVGK
jgi:signal peptidase I